MKYSIKLFLLSLLTPLLCFGVSFANSPYVLQVNGCDCVRNMANCLSQLDREYITNSYFTSPVCFNFFFEDNYHIFSSVNFQGNYSNGNYSFDFNSPYKSFGFCDSDINRLLNSFDNIHFQGNVNMCQELPMTISFYDSNSFGGDCSSVESQLSTCQSSLSGANSSLSSCQSDLASCTNSCDTLVSQCQQDKSSLQSSYSGCLESNASLNNYNSSLLDQLEACYISGSTTTGDLTIYEYQLSRFDGLTDLYLPITNSIKLPYGYRGFLDNGVLAIKDLDSLDIAYNIDNSDFKENVIGSYSVVYLFLMSSGLFLIFLYILRRYFIGLKSVK